MQLPGDGSGAGPAPLRNPLAGTTLVVAAGSQREIEFDVHNDSPKVASFSIQMEAPVAEWATGTGEAGAVILAPSGSGTLRLRLTPPIRAMGDYAFRVRVVTNTGMVMQDTALVLRVERSTPEIKALVESGLALVEMRSVSSSGISPAAPGMPLAGNGLTNGTASAVLPESRAAISDIFADPPDGEPLKAITFPPYDAGSDKQDTPSEPFVIDPKEGASLPVRPGETLLIRFGFVNTGMKEITYILDEDSSLPDGWMILVQDQVNVTRNGSDEVSLRLTPPPTAEPGEYPFKVMFGLQGSVLTARTLLLSVIATPAIRLKAQRARIVIGAMHGSGRFALEVSNAGNANTAFRIAVQRSIAAKKEASERGEQDQPSDDMAADDNKNLYETKQWQYLFNRELDTIRSPAPNRLPAPVTIQLRLRRRGWWWLGMREQHKIRVTAVPVTEPENGGKSGNSVELTVVRWRPIPFPLIFLAPLVILLIVLFMGQPGVIKVNSACYIDKQQNTAYVVDPPGASNYIDLSWQTTASSSDNAFLRFISRFALLRLEAKRGAKPFTKDMQRVYFGSDTYRTLVKENGGSRMGLYYFTLSNILHAGKIQSALVRCINTSEDTPLCVKTSINGGCERNWVGDGKKGYEWKNSENHVYEVCNPELAYKKRAFPSLPTDVIRLTVSPGDTILLKLVNLALATDSLNYTVATGLGEKQRLGEKTAKARNYTISTELRGKKTQTPWLSYKYISRDGSIRWKDKSVSDVNSDVNTVQIPIKVDARAVSPCDDDIVFVTTSTQFPLVKIHIELAPRSSAPLGARPGTAGSSVRPSTGISTAAARRNR